MSENCPRCQAQARQHAQKLRVMREKIALAELRFRMLKIGKTPTKVDEKAAIKNAHARHEREEQERQWRASERTVPGHRCIR